VSCRHIDLDHSWQMTTYGVQFMLDMLLHHPKVSGKLCHCVTHASSCCECPAEVYIIMAVHSRSATNPRAEHLFRMYFYAAMRRHVMIGARFHENDSLESVMRYACLSSKFHQVSSSSCRCLLTLSPGPDGEP
jgi:hypothetical protein